MSAPARQRTSTGIRLDDALHERLAAAAADHGVTFNWLIGRAVAYYLDRLLPADQVRWTRDDPDPAPVIDPFSACWVASDRLVHLFAGAIDNGAATYCGQAGIGSFRPDGGSVAVTCPTCAEHAVARHHTEPRV